MTLEEALTGASASLADGCATIEDVAVKLKAARCEGRPGNPLQCPLARWFGRELRERRVLRRRQAVSVDGTTWGRTYLYVHVRERSGRGPGACPPLPAPPLLVQFASQFDSGGFPELRA
jgi:hypothetical protein